MYSMENYLWGSIGYVLGVLLMLPLLWRCTRWLHWHPLRAGIRLLVLVVLLTPARPYPDKIFLAPAWAVSVFEIVQPTTTEGALKGVLPIATYFLGLFALELIIWSLWTQFYAPRPRPPTTGRRPQPVPASVYGGGASRAEDSGQQGSAATKVAPRNPAPPTSGADARRGPAPPVWGNTRHPGDGKKS